MNQSYYIRTSPLDSNSKDIFYEGAHIGTVSPCSYQEGFVVQPKFADYSGFFLTFEKACVELIFHYWTNRHKVSVYC